MSPNVGISECDHAAQCFNVCALMVALHMQGRCEVEVGVPKVVEAPRGDLRLFKLELHLCEVDATGPGFRANLRHSSSQQYHG